VCQFIIIIPFAFISYTIMQQTHNDDDGDGGSGGDDDDDDTGPIWLCSTDVNLIQN